MELNDAFAPLGTESLPPRQTVSWHPIMPVPPDAPKVTVDVLTGVVPRTYYTDGYAFTKAWAYRDASDHVLGYIVRLDRPANGQPAAKVILPITFGEEPAGRREFRCKGFPEPRPLYGLNILAGRPDAPVLVLEGEKTAKAAMDRFPGHVCITSPGGSKAARKADWRAVRGRRVTIVPDNDEPGLAYAADVADLAHRAGAASVAIVALPAGLPVGWDVADDLPEGVTWANIEASVATAASVAAPRPDSPLPLFPPLAPAKAYPVEALGPLAAAAKAIASKVQVPDAMAGQAVLAAASLACQAHADVMLPYGQSRPVSLYFVTVAGSGERKSTADNEALWPVYRREKTLREIHTEEMKTWRIAFAAWSAEKKKIEGNGKIDHSERRERLGNLGEEPAKPLAPFLVTGDMTPDGLTKNWPDAHAALGVFTAEGGVFTGSHGMNDDNKLRTAAMLSELWDGKPVKRIRAGDGISILPGRRLAMHVMVQPDAAGAFLSDPTLRDQGLLSRALVSAPASLAGTRFYRDATPDEDSAIRTYGARMLSILEATPALADGTRNELEPRDLLLTAEAAERWKAFFDHVERQLGTSEEFRAIQDVGAKAAEQAARIAGVLALYENLAATEIGLHPMKCAIKLTDFYVGEALRMHSAGRTDPKLRLAQRLLDWLQGLGGEPIPFRDVVRLGPNPLRTKDVAEAAMTILISHGWVVETSRRPRTVQLVSEV